MGQHCTQTIMALPESNKAMAPFGHLQGSLSLCATKAAPTQGGGSSPDQAGPCKLLPGGVGSESVE